MATDDDVDLAYEMTLDTADPACGRERRVPGVTMGNLTARGTHITYVVHRLGDPLNHVPGSHSSRTACNYPVAHYDEVVDARDRPELVVTCVSCMATWVTRVSLFDLLDRIGFT